LPSRGGGYALDVEEELEPDEDEPALDELGDPAGGVPLGPGPWGMSSWALPAWSLSMAVVPLVVTVLKVTASPAARSLSEASPFLSMSLLLVTAYVVVPLLVWIVTLEVPTAVTVPLSGRL
jgi:hypothetical protein